MATFLFIPFILFICLILFIVIAFLIYRKIKRGLKYTYDKSTEFSEQYREKLRSKEQRNKLPKIVQKGLDDFQVIEKTIEQLPAIWQLKLLPLKQKSNSLLNEISHHLISDESLERSRLNSVRSFFNHSLDALKQLTQKLLSDHKSLTELETEKAKENIQIIYKDLLRQEKILHKSRKFDFDVVMDVIKARLKS